LIFASFCKKIAGSLALHHSKMTDWAFLFIMIDSWDKPYLAEQGIYWKLSNMKYVEREYYPKILTHYRVQWECFHILAGKQKISSKMEQKQQINPEFRQ